MFGYVELDRIAWGVSSVRTPANLPVEPDAPPTFTVHGPSGPIPGVAGTLEPLDPQPAPGLYRWEFEAAGSLGFEVGQAYMVIVSATTDDGEFRFVERAIVHVI